MDAARAPPAVGEKVALTVQALPAASEAGLAGHVLAEMAKSPGFAPASTKLVKVTALLPVLVTVTLWAALVVPVFWVANVRLRGLKVNVKIAPVPLKAIDCGLPVALSVTEIDALRAPPAVGEKVADTLQALPAAKLAGLMGQVLAPKAKSPGFAPDSAKLVKVTAPVPVLVTVTLCAALVVPIVCVAKVRLAGLKPKDKVAAERSVKPPGSVSTSEPVVMTTLAAPSGALGVMVMFAVRLVGLATLTEFTVTPGPKLAVVIPWKKFEKLPVTTTLSV